MEKMSDSDRISLWMLEVFAKVETFRAYDFRIAFVHLGFLSTPSTVDMSVWQMFSR